jgi:hypothetical protein
VSFLLLLCMFPLHACESIDVDDALGILLSFSVTNSCFVQLLMSCGLCVHGRIIANCSARIDVR